VLEHAAPFASDQCPEGLVAIVKNTLRILTVDNVGEAFNTQVGTRAGAGVWVGGGGGGRHVWGVSEVAGGGRGRERMWGCGGRGQDVGRDAPLAGCVCAGGTHVAPVW
jgi:hypothetical protein